MHIILQSLNPHGKSSKPWWDVLDQRDGIISEKRKWCCVVHGRVWKTRCIPPTWPLFQTIYDKSCWSKPTWFSDPLCDIMWYQAHSLASLKKWLRSWNDNGIWKLAHANMLASRPFYSPSPLHWPEVPPENHQNWGKAWVPGWKRTEMTQTPSISQFPRPETAEYVRVHGSCPGSWECSKLVTLQNSEVS